MCSRHPEPGAGHPDNFDDVSPIVREATRDFIEKYRSTLDDLAAPTCTACSLPAVRDGLCRGHDRLATQDYSEIAANE